MNIYPYIQKWMELIHMPTEPLEVQIEGLPSQVRIKSMTIDPQISPTTGALEMTVTVSFDE